MLTYFRIEMTRILRDPFALLFTVGIPTLMYVIFGATADWGDIPLQNGNVAMYVMINMGAYGAVTATTSGTGMAAVEKMQGWGRQLSLTPMPDSRFVLVKVLVSAIVAAIPISLIYVIGAATGASAQAWVWFAAAGITLLGSIMFSLYGIAVGLAFRSESSVGVASGFLVILGFLGNVFVPLSGLMLTIAKFTPLYGLAALARWPLTGGRNIDMEVGLTAPEPLWQVIANVVAWMTIFGVSALLLVRRSRDRQ